MKLQQLHEAGYAGDHAIVGVIKNMIAMQIVSDKFFDIQPNDLKHVVDSITKNFGKPRMYSDHTYYWIVNVDDHNAYALDIGYDEMIDPPYGITISHKVQGT